MPSPLFLYPQEEWRATQFALDGHPHLRGVRVQSPDITQYNSLLAGGAMSAEASTLLLEHHLKVLKLPTFVRDYKSVAAVCARRNAAITPRSCCGWPSGS